MRLTASEQSKIQSTLKFLIPNFEFKIFLFGSRIDNSKKGGDIDLLLLVNENDFDLIYQKKALLKFELEDAMGDQRVDLTLTTLAKKENDFFINEVFKTAIEL